MASEDKAVSFSVPEGRANPSVSVGHDIYLSRALVVILTPRTQGGAIITVDLEDLKSSEISPVGF